MDICPLSNQPCPHRRTTHVTEINNGKITELHLCENCASKYPEKTPPPPVEVKDEPPTQQFNPSAWAVVPGQQNSLMSLLALLTGGLGGNQVRPKVPIYPPCTKCGHTTEDIRKTGRMGCPHCYDHFGKAIMQVIARCQQGVQHVGKKPKGWDEKQVRAAAEAAADIEDRINSLKLKMAKAIEVENYEVAGVLKKKIEELRKPSETSPTPPSSEGL